MNKCIKWISITLVLPIVSTWAILFFMPLPPLLTEVSFSRAIYDDHQHLLRLTLSHDTKFRLMTPLSAISPTLQRATLLQEDQYFYWHVGINPISLLKAGWQTYGKESRRVGASTITMQVARMRYNIHSKSLSGKVWQIVRALQLEMHYSKKQILEAYLNLAPYGNNVEGVGAASLLYFNKPASTLNLPESLTLAVIPQNPTKRLPNQIELKEIRNKLFYRWLIKHPADKKHQSLMNLPLQMRSIHSAPFQAPHFVNDILVKYPFGRESLTTTLNLNLQKNIQHITQRYISSKNNVGIHNAAVMLVDTRDMGVKALIGSTDFFNRTIGGQINGTDIKRSPGSTLKPFIYALALDQSLIHPATVLKDVPRSFGSYNPENFDYDFVGPIKAKDALILSRNIPAVYLADQLKHPSLYEFLQQAHVAPLKSESFYGLALVLGGAEMTMQELVGLYATLANQGIWKPLRFTADDQSDIHQRLLSPEASYLVLDMLKETKLPGTHFGMATSSTIPIAWKTGTSSGFRDAWTIGVVGPYVLAVWIGNFNNQSNHALIGKDMAAPLFFEIANAMKSQVNLTTHSANKKLHLTKIDICKASGMLPTRYCTETEKTWFIPGKSPITTDTIFREVAIDTRTGLRTCHFNEYTKFAVYEFWSSDLLKIFKRSRLQRRSPPPFESDCAINAKDMTGISPQITSPKKTVNYITRLQSTTTTIPFIAVTDADVTNLHWFINETYAGKTPRDQTFFWQAKPGKYIVRVVDDHGRSDARDLQVSVES